MSKSRASSRRRRSLRPAARMREYFKSAAPVTRNHVAGIFDRIAVFAAASTQGRNAVAYAVPKLGIIGTCPGYYQKQLQNNQCHYRDQAFVTLHETGHLFGLKDINRAYSYEQTRALSAAQNLRHTNSYSYFAKELLRLLFSHARDFATASIVTLPAAQKALTLRDAEARYAGSARASIDRIVKRLEAANTVAYEDVADAKIGRPQQLTEEEEEAIVSYIIWMQKSGLPAAKWEIEDAALTLPPP
ncbi:uncharacterized protein FPOAC1_014142 [Fusarium poae]|uniref:uncharacterized protein n=1 Tax=Fusarium poae TaxID=36050 RepID=UPI001D049E19|nr:uncharacterized protein FPOAC1_014142 [Fusarium poae]KAG8664075.1 hypothetical protein FPOAC1_014142 [Fusarium poae]